MARVRCGFFANAASQLPALLDLRGNEKLLDIATGTGLASTLLASHLPDGQVTGIDRSEGMLNTAQAMADDTTIVLLKAPTADYQIYPVVSFDRACAVHRCASITPERPINIG